MYVIIHVLDPLGAQQRAFLEVCQQIGIYAQAVQGIMQSISVADRHE